MLRETTALSAETQTPHLLLNETWAILWPWEQVAQPSHSYATIAFGLLRTLKGTLLGLKHNYFLWLVFFSVESIWKTLGIMLGSHQNYVLIHEMYVFIHGLLQGAAWGLFRRAKLGWCWKTVEAGGKKTWCHDVYWNWSPHGLSLQPHLGTTSQRPGISQSSLEAL